MSSSQEARSLDLEEQRQEILKEMIAEHGPEWTSQFGPGTMGCHELLDRTLLAAETVEQYVLSHPACAQNPEWYALAEQAVTALNELYQQIGAEHLSEKNNGASQP
jgi:hypothetical protein